MYDLIGSHLRLKHIYRSYIESAFPLRFEALNKERERLLDNENLENGAYLTQPPLIEPMPLYPSSGLTLRETAAKLGQDYEGFEDLARDLVPQGVELYEHQDRSLKTALADKDLVVTTGTGSGKTECFLLPLFAQLAREMRDWPEMGRADTKREWWREPAEERGTPKREVGQFRHSRRPHAMRALILYPLNALVEDQLRRLRRALDNPETRRWLDNKRGKNRIHFGRYTGATPVSGQPGNRTKTNELARVLRDLHKREQDILDKLDRAHGLEKRYLAELRYFFPSLHSGEMWSRWDMQETPPDILITNYSMLNIMLNRQVEESIFEQTRDWLRSNNTNRFHLIVDELHAYRGTQGTEVGYILRLLLHRLGLSPGSDQLRILTTSASIEENDKSRRFLEEFFGRPRDRFVIVNSREIDPKPGARAQLSLHAPAFQSFCEAIDTESVAAIGADHAPWRPPVDAPEEIASAMTKLALELAEVDKRQTDRHFLLGAALQKINAGDALRDAVREAAGGQVRAVPLTRLDQVLFDPSAPRWKPFPDEPTGGLSKPLRGLLLALALSRRGEQDDRSVAPVRGHLFYHNHQNLWACCNPACHDSNCMPEERSRDGDIRPPIGALHATHQLSCSCGGRVLDLVVCECCGEVFLGGHVSPGPHGHNEILTADTGLKTLSSELQRKTNASYRLFWPSSDQTPAPGFDSYTVEKRPRRWNHRWNKAHLHPFSGLLCGSAAPDAAALGGWVYRVDPNPEMASALPPKCPNCDADYRRRDRNPTPMRNHRTGFQKACQVLSTALAREMPPGGERPERKMVLFTDSRQDAAKLAAGVENDHYRDLIRIAVLGAPQTFWEPFVAMLARLAKKASSLLDRLSTNPQLQEDVKAGRCMNASIEYLDRKGRAAEAADRGSASVLKSWALDMEPDDPEVEQRLKRRIANYPHSMPLTAVRDAVLMTLLCRGVHPGGIVYRWQSYRDQGGNRTHWYEIFSWPERKDEAPIKRAELPPEGDNLYTSLSLALLAELMYALFPHRARTAEGLGQAWVTCDDLDKLPDKIRQATDTVIRMLGERRIHRLRGYTAAGQRWNTEGTEDKFPPWVGGYLGNVGVPSNTLKQTLKDRGAIVGGFYHCRLAPDALMMRLPEPTRDGKTSGWRCPRCRTFYLQPSNGVCHHCRDCRGVLVESPRPQVFDYYVYLSDHSGPPFRFNVAELTGQTDKNQRLDRQCRFQEIFLEDEPRQPTGIDMLAVTTTMEAGVDIGGLQAVMLANMPPRRFNYQQRVGRAGRRGAGLSLALTFCRGRSHDDFYYQRPMAMTGDPPPPPYVDVKREPIIRRAINKEVLRLGLRGAPEGDGASFADSVHGELGSVIDWIQVPERRAHLGAWLEDAENESVIGDIIRSLTPGTPFQQDVDFVREQLARVRGELPVIIDQVAKDHRLTQEALSERLANAGHLPMFGFPTRVRNLFTRYPSGGAGWPPERDVIDRGLDVAVSQFAPASETVKDKAIHTAVGVAHFHPGPGGQIVADDGFAPPLTTVSRSPVGSCRNCEAIIDQGPELEALPDSGDADCPICGKHTLGIIDAREPRGFVTDFHPRDYDANEEYVPRASRPRIGIRQFPTNLPVLGNVRLWAEELDVLSINDNGGVGGFEFAWLPLGPNNQRAWQCPGVLSDLRGDDQRQAVQTHLVSLLSRRHTDVLLVDVDAWPTGVAASPETHEGKAAWYSLAFLLRAAATALMDVDTNELEAGVRTVLKNGTPCGQVFLCDSLDNGAGYARWLSEPPNFIALLDRIQGNHKDTIAQIWWGIAEAGAGSHGRSCDTSCNRCLRDHANTIYHPWLDWRLALDMARLAADQSVSIQLAADDKSTESIWTPLVDSHNGRIKRLLGELGWQHEDQVHGLNVYRDSNSPDRFAVEVHPIWTSDHPEWRTALDAIKAQWGGADVGVINPFRLIREPAAVFGGR